MSVQNDAPWDDPHFNTSNYMRLILTLVALLLSSCSVFKDSHQSCKILDPDLAQGIFHGGCKNGWADGYGEINVSEEGGSISSYRGDFVLGKKQGKGTKIMPNGDRYTGEFRDDFRDGQGVYVWGDKTPWAGDRYEGQYHHDLRQGWGVYQWGNGDRYEGLWENDLRIGPSVMELRRAQAGLAVARSIKIGSMVCADERWDGINIQHIRGIVESIKNKSLQVRIAEVDGGSATYHGTTLKTGGLLVDEVAHWRLCAQN